MLALNFAAGGDGYNDDYAELRALAVEALGVKPLKPHQYVINETRDMQDLNARQFAHLYLLLEQEKKANTLGWFFPQIYEISVFHHSETKTRIPFRGALNLFLNGEDFKHWASRQVKMYSKVIDINAPQTVSPATHPEHR